MNTIIFTILFLTSLIILALLTINISRSINSKRHICFLLFMFTFSVTITLILFIVVADKINEKDNPCPNYKKLENVYQLEP